LRAFSKFIVTMVIILNILFTLAILYLFWLKGQEPRFLIGAWFAFTTGELWMLASIRNTKTKNPPEKVVKRDL